MRSLGPAFAILLCACSVSVQSDTSTTPTPPVAAAEPPATEEPATPVDPIPAMFGALTPQIAVDDVGAAMDFYAKAFAATEVMRMPGPDGKTMHGEVKIGDSLIMIDLANPSMQSPKTVGGTPLTLFMYSADADEAFKTAVAAGATSLMPLEDQFWGDRYGELADPFGHRWAIASHIEDLTDEQMGQRAAMMAEEMAAAAKRKGGKLQKARRAKDPKWKSVVGTPSTQPIPEGYQTLTMAITVADAAAAIEFYTTVLGATERVRMPTPDGKLMHAEVAFGDNVLMLSDEMYPARKSAKTLGASPFMIHHYVTDAEATYAKAIAAGSTSILPVTDMFWGDRYGAVMEPSGVVWGLATHIEDVPPEEMTARMEKQMKGSGEQPAAAAGNNEPKPVPATSTTKPIAPKAK